MFVDVLDALMFDLVSSALLLLPVDTKCPGSHVCGALPFNNVSLSFKELDWHQKEEIKWANNRAVTQGNVVFYAEGSTEDVGVTLMTT